MYKLLLRISVVVRLCKGQLLISNGNQLKLNKRMKPIKQNHLNGNLIIKLLHSNNRNLFTFRKDL